MSFQLSLAKHNPSLRHHQSLKSQHGVVMVIALFIVALIATMTYFMMARLERDTRRTTLILREAQAENYAHGSVVWAIDQLKNNWKMQKENQLIDPIPIISPINNVNGYQIKSTITDMQSRFNLNDMSDPEYADTFIRLIRTVIPPINLTDARKIAEALSDWVGNNKETGLSKYYLTLSVPYRASRKPMTTTSELLLVKGMSQDIFNALKPYISALPLSPIKINVQTAPVPILMSLDPTLSLDTAKGFVASRKQNPIVSLDSELLKKLQIKPEKITVVSAYFLVETEVSIEGQRLLLYTLLERNANDKNAEIHIIWQAKGVGE